MKYTALRMRAVRMWLDEQAAETLFLSSVTLAGLLFGIRVLPTGQRKDALTQTLAGLLELFGDRELAFDTNAARHYAELDVPACAASKELPTHDVAPFHAVGLDVINPWEAM